MATVHYKTCDHCGKRLDSMHDYDDYEVDLIGYVDLCADCFHELTRIAREFVERRADDGQAG